MKHTLLIMLSSVGLVAQAQAVNPIVELRGKDKSHIISSSEISHMRHYYSKGDSIPSIRVSHGKAANKTLEISRLDSCVFYNPDIPTFYFRTPSKPEAEQVWLKEDYTEAELDILGNGMTDDLEGLKVNIKGRGNTTWAMAKKPMRLKFDKKTSICGMNKAKSFVLLANYSDASGLHNATALWLAKRLGIPYSNSFVPCNVFMNGNFLGMFQLTEKIGVGGASVDIDENEGVLIELSSEFDEKYKFRSKLTNLPVMIKDPDFDELYEANPEVSPEGRLKRWQKDFDEMEDYIVNRIYFDEHSTFADVLDQESFVNFLALQAISANTEVWFPKSFYIWKEKTGYDVKYHAGPAWDFDICFTRRQHDKDGNLMTLSPTMGLGAHAFITKITDNDYFRELYSKRLTEIKETVLPELLDFIDSYADTIEQSHLLDVRKWDKQEDYDFVVRVPAENIQAEKDELKEWIVNRIEFLEDRINNEGKIW